MPEVIRQVKHYEEVTRLVLIDNPRNNYSHMVCADIPTLHAFAESIGIKKCWYSNKRGKKRPHYDVKESKFQEAIDAGAVVVSSEEIVLFLKRHFE
jgi:hypothetical protein